MTQEQVKQFKKEFQSIVYWQGLLTAANNHIRKCTRYDNDGSHKAAIDKAFANKQKIKDTLEEKLKGRTYQEWAEFSKKLTAASKVTKSYLLEIKPIEQLEFNL